MMRWVRIEDVGDTDFLIDEQTDKFRSQKETDFVPWKRKGRSSSTGLSSLYVVYRP